MIIGIGILIKNPPPKKLKDSGKLKIGLPEVMNNASPLAILIIANVEIKGGILILLVINIPLKSPQRIPAPIPKIIEKKIPIPTFLRKTPVIIPLKAATEPTDKSIPPVIMT